MKETLTAKEWVEKGFAPIKNLVGDENGTIQQQYIEDCMEQYANYRTKELENKIIEFRNKFKDVAMLRRVDEHFNIK